MKNLLDYYNYIIFEDMCSELEIFVECGLNEDELNDYFDFTYGIDMLNEDEHEQKPGGIKGHFKKHWKKYAAGAGALALAGGAAYAHHKGYLGGKKSGNTSAPAKPVPTPSAPTPSAPTPSATTPSATPVANTKPTTSVADLHNHFKKGDKMEAASKKMDNFTNSDKFKSLSKDKQSKIKNKIADYGSKVVNHHMSTVDKLDI